MVSRFLPEPGEGSRTFRTHSGVCEGAFFSKKAWPVTPSGHRVNVTGRDRTWGRSAGAMRV